MLRKLVCRSFHVHSRLFTQLRPFSSTRKWRSNLDGTLRDENITAFVAEYRNPLNQLFLSIGGNKNCLEKAVSIGISANSWHSFLSGFRRKIIKEPDQTLGSDGLADLCSHIGATSFMHRADPTPFVDNADEVAAKFLFDLALSKAEVHFKDSIALHRTLCNMTDLRAPHEWYPSTRMRKRKVIYHGGPTNSGKTYQALQRLQQADPELGGGLYCGPLRLLALEVYESLNRNGIYCDLRTGQELREVPMATHVSSTLEMVNLNKEYDVVVIDEIQMITDAQRGYAWTKTVLGIQANEIHVCGGLEAFEIVQTLMEQTQDDFELCKYERMSNLVISEESLQGDYSSVRPGDCVVAFSRKDIFAIKAEIEKLTKHKCAVIYGQLPSDIRSEQARLFNELDTGYDILVASDAIGMGLNLNIGRIIFHTTVKRGRAGQVTLDGQQAPSVYFVDPSNVKQIAGRAGRRSSQFEVGTVTAWQDSDLAYVRAVMQYDIPQIKAAGLFPSIEQIEEFSGRLASASSLMASQDGEPSDSLESDVESEDESESEGASTDGVSVTEANNDSKMTNYKSELQMLVLKKSRSSKNLISYTTAAVEGCSGFSATALVELPDLPETLFSSTADAPDFSSKKLAEQAAARAAFEALGGKLSSEGVAKKVADSTTGDDNDESSPPTSAVVATDPNYVQLSNVLDRFLQLSQLDGGQYFMCNSSDIALVSNWLHTIPMSLSDRFVFANAPVNTNDALTMNQLYAFAASFAMKRPVGIAMVLPTLQPRDLFEFSDLCVKHNILELYIWLSLRFPQFFVERESCLVRREHTLGMIEATLMGSALKAKSSLKDDYLGLWKKLGVATGETYLPPDTDVYCAVRPTAQDYLARLSSREPVFREKSWAKAGAGGSAGRGAGTKANGAKKSTKSFFGKVKEKEKPVPTEGKSGIWKKASPTGTTGGVGGSGGGKAGTKPKMYTKASKNTQTMNTKDFEGHKTASEKKGSSDRKVFNRVSGGAGKKGSKVKEADTSAVEVKDGAKVVKVETE